MSDRSKEFEPPIRSAPAGITEGIEPEPVLVVFRAVPLPHYLIQQGVHEIGKAKTPEAARKIAEKRAEERNVAVEWRLP